MKPGKTVPKPETDTVRRHAVILAGLWAVILIAYSSAFQAGLVFDNAALILKDPRVHAATSQNLGLIFTNEYWYPVGGNGLYRPLTTLSYLFNYAILGNGSSPFGYHVINYVLHALNASLVYFLGLLLFEAINPASALALLWGLHPVLTESVTNIVGRADLLSTMGVLVALLCFIQGRWALAAIATAAGMFSKESAIVVLAAAVLYDVIFRETRPLRNRAAGYAALVAPCLLFLAVRAGVLANSTPTHFPFTDNPLVGADFLTARLTAIKVLGKELLLLVWPAQLSSDYSYHQIPMSSWSDWRMLAALAILLAMAAAAIFCYRRNRLVTFGIGLLLAALAPTSNLIITIGSIMAERFLYLPAIGFACLAVALIPRKALPAITALVCMAFGARTFARNLDWKDDQSLWSSAVQVSPDSYKTHMQLAIGNFDQALPQIETAMRLLEGVPDDRNTPLPYMNAGSLYRRKGDTLLTRGPDGIPTGTAASDEWHRKALAVLLRAEAIQNANPGTIWYPMYQELGRTYSRLRDYDHAIAALNIVIKGQPAVDVYEQLAVVYVRKNDLKQAALTLLAALSLDPQNAKVAAELKDTYGRLDPAARAELCATTGQPVFLGCR